MKVKVLYLTTVEIEVEVDPKYDECIKLTDLPYGQFPADCLNKWNEGCDSLTEEIENMLPQIDPDYEKLYGIFTKDGNPIYEY